jgi:nucleoside-diphosphate-sugar epimerase
VVLKKVFLTGCSGLVGRHIYFKLLKENYSICCVSRRKPYFIKKKHWTHLDLKKIYNYNYYLKKFENISYIVHVAAQLPKNRINIKKKDYVAINYKPTKLLAQWALKKKIPMIYLSGTIVSKKNFINFKSSIENIKYLKSKLLVESYLLKQKFRGLKVTIVRATSIFGWGLGKDKIIIKLLNFKKKTFEIDFKYNYLYDFIHAYDVARLIVCIIKKKIMLDIVSIGGIKLNIVSLVKKIFNFQNKKINIINSNNYRKVKLVNIYKYSDKNLQRFNFKRIISFKRGLELLSKKKAFE